jgi:hypothetical protein
MDTTTRFWHGGLRLHFAQEEPLYQSVSEHDATTAQRSETVAKI